MNHLPSASKSTINCAKSKGARRGSMRESWGGSAATWTSCRERSHCAPQPMNRTPPVADPVPAQTLLADLDSGPATRERIDDGQQRDARRGGVRDVPRLLY